MFDFRELTCSVVGMSEAELWHHVREACRQNSYSWNAYEKLHSERVRLTKRAEDDACECGVTYVMNYEDGSQACANFNAHRR